MTFNRDKKFDIKQTNSIILKKRKPSYTGESWLGHTKDCGIIDHELLKGATKDELIKRSGRELGGVDSHISHLKAEHGLIVSKNNDIYKFEYYHPETNKILNELDLENLMKIDIENVAKYSIVQLKNKEGDLKWYSIGIETQNKNGEEVTSLTENKGFAQKLINKKVGDYVDFGTGFKITKIKKYLSK
ncbi:hypothetical protein [Psychroserpens burtonensis]|uniref:hypothetical protein n=1 Tax=Psychroserpens burtonensis TaxID=49278 RepID=UPI0004246ABD|nr:hypothetical protein [Psychroserpens burtonensis]